MLDAVAEIRGRAPKAPICIDPHSAVNALILDLEAGGDLVKTTAADLSAACGAFYKAVDEHTVRYRRQRALEDAVDRAGTRPLAGAWVWAADPDADITPLRAVTLAFHAHRTRADSKGETTLW